ncbi:MAG: uracil-DNA glycosylase [Sulfuritalea sp.]|nr:uracil-DNA glycosylase [Sulfuritalea sp.]
MSLFPEQAFAPQLHTAESSDWRVHSQWQALVDSFFESQDGVNVRAFLAQRLAHGAVIFPPQPLKALELTPPQAIHTVILGQDPYHGRGQAEGLAFSVAPGVGLPPSLRNIFKERLRDLGEPFPLAPVPGGSLMAWAHNGVLLLNTCLTVEEGRPNSHSGQGWEALTDAVIRAVSQGAQPVAFLLWGANAQSKKSLIDSSRHLVLTANHPSPLSAMRPPTPFLGCSHFSKALAWQKSLTSDRAS